MTGAHPYSSIRDLFVDGFLDRFSPSLRDCLFLTLPNLDFYPKLRGKLKLGLIFFIKTAILPHFFVSEHRRLLLIVLRCSESARQGWGGLALKPPPLAAEKGSFPRTTKTCPPPPDARKSDHHHLGRLGFIEFAGTG